MEDEKIGEKIPRCPGCNRHSEFMVINKKTGEKKFFCEMCGRIEMLKYKNDDWDFINLG